MATLSYQPWYTGMLSPVWVCPLSTDSGTELDLTGLSPSNLTLLFKNTTNQAETNGTGSFVITQYKPGIVTYQPSAADVAAAASYQLWIIVQYGNGPSQYGPVTFVVTAK